MDELFYRIREFLKRQFVFLICIICLYNFFPLLILDGAVTVIVAEVVWQFHFGRQIGIYRISKVFQINESITILINYFEYFLYITFGKNLLMVDSCCEEFLEINLPILIKVEVVKDMHPLVAETKEILKLMIR